MANHHNRVESIYKIQEQIETLLKDNTNVFVAVDLLWYPVAEDMVISQSPDIMVVFGRSKNDRYSYQQWEENNIIPQVVFDVLSPSDSFSEMLKKFKFYDMYGVEEYYIYDPDRGELSGYIRCESELKEVEDMKGFVSPLLGVRFELMDRELKIDCSEVKQVLSYIELEEKANRLAEKLREMGVNPDEI